ncbi:MAG: hypothetical protein H6821_08715 [Planctomycetaceae bacterium]|nr:hypothetical protein [Planctomycetales bacterium]MCB9874249.1 hypothetical protein [Planctomycetaceae bacterium]HRX78685.1 hypothetical protein [Pirellulaceae bacterium]
MKRVASIAVVLMLLPATSGCIGLLSTLRWIGGGNPMPAEYAGLKGKRVAVVCVSEDSSYGTGSESLLLAREVSSILGKNVKEIELVRADEIADWVDREGWDEIDYREIGRGVKADRVLAVGLGSFSIREGASLYKGRADITVSVYDMEDGGHEVFRKTVPEFSFPATGPYPVGDLSEVQFRRAFLKTLSNHVARHFYSYDPAEDFSRDSAFIRP